MSAPDRAAEAAYLAARCQLVLDAICAADEQRSPVLAQVGDVLHARLRKRDVRGLEIILRDLREMSLVLSSDQRRSLEVALRAHAVEDPRGRSAG